jgi:hypothetical protein
MTEAELAGQVAELAGKHGLWWHHCLDSRHCEGPPGFPDLIIAGPRGTLIRELKTQSGPVHREQRIWLRILDGKIWRPADLRSGLIENELKAISGFVPRCDTADQCEFDPACPFYRDCKNIQD